MPYVVVERGGEFDVYREVGGRPSGESLGSHPSRESALDQIAALHTNEEKAVWEESKHPRAENGQFRSGGGGGGGNSEEKKPEGEDKPEEEDKPEPKPEEKPKGEVKVSRVARDGEKGLTAMGTSSEDVTRIATGGNLSDLGLSADVEMSVKAPQEGAFGKKMPGRVEVFVEGKDLGMRRALNYDPDGKPDFIENQYFELSEEARGKGLGTTIFHAEVVEAQKAGFKRITTEAVRTEFQANGYYTWARLGYDADVDGPSGRTRVSDLMSTPEGRTWWKENGKTTDMEFDLTPGSRSMRVLEEYQRERAARGGKAMDGENDKITDPIVLTEEDERLLDQIWEKIRREKEEKGKVEESTKIEIGTKSMSAETFYLSAMALKALEGDAGRIGGYLVSFGMPKDKQGEYFGPDTDFHLDWYGDGPRPVLFHHGLTRDLAARAIGRVTSMRVDDNGIWADAELDLEDEDARRVYELVKRGKIGWSSGSLPHLVKTLDDGKIIEWPIIEASLTPKPAEPYRTNVQAMKALVEGLRDDDPEGVIETGEDAATSGGHTEVTTPTVLEHNDKSFIGTKRGMKMDTNMIVAACEKVGLNPEQTLAVLKELSMPVSAEETLPEEAPPEEAMAADAGSMSEEERRRLEEEGKSSVKTFDPKAFAALVRDEMTASEPRGKALPFTGGSTGKSRIEVYSKYRGMKSSDMAFLLHLRGAVARSRGLAHNPGDPFVREMAAKAQREITDGALVLEPKAAQRIMALKSNELNSTAAADDGADWVTTIMATDLWEKARVDNVVLQNMNTIEMPSDSYDLPIESTDPTVYSVAETTAASELVLTGSGTFTQSKVVSDKVTLNAAKLGLQVAFSAEINEDSVIPFIPQLRKQSMRAMQDALDNVILNADATTGTGNINYKGANTSAAAKSKFLYGGGDGIRHLCLVDATTNALDANGSAPTLSLWRSALAKMSNAYSIRPSDIVAFCDVKTYHKLKSIDELLVYMNNGRGSTVNDGLVPTIDGSPVYPTAELALTDSTGYALAAGTGTLGQVVFVYKPGWYVGFRRQITSAVDYLAYYDSYVMTMTVRLALARRDTGVASLLYNLSIS